MVFFLQQCSRAKELAVCALLLAWPSSVCSAASGPGRWTLDVGRWTLDVGRWTLDAGRWTLDAGRWTLNVGR